MLVFRIYQPKGKFLDIVQVLVQVAWIMAWWEGKKLDQNLALNSGLL